MDNIFDLCCKKEKKKIQFNNIIKVRLIFNICNYVNIEDIWWNQNDINNFRLNYKLELNSIIHSDIISNDVVLNL